jgi:elongation factor G
VQITEIELFGSASTVDALQAAATRALNQAIAHAHPTLLQPIMATEVIVPEENLGTVLGDLQSRHAVIHDTAKSGMQATVQCEVSLAKLLGYMTELRNMTQGRGAFTTQFLRFDIC